MANLAAQIRGVYPALTINDFRPGGSIVIADKGDGSGPYIAQWSNTTYAQPTAAQLAAATPRPFPPAEVPMWAVRTVLQNNNLLSQAQTDITNSNNLALQNAWQYAHMVERTSSSVASLAALLGLTDAQVDQMFIDAGNIAI